MNKVSKQFIDSLIGCESNIENDEWYFCKSRENIINSLSPNEAFDSIMEILNLAVIKEYHDFLDLILQFALELSLKSETTQLPQGLENILNEIYLIIPNIDKEYYINKINEVCNFYRINNI